MSRSRLVISVYDPEFMFDDSSPFRARWRDSSPDLTRVGPTLKKVCSSRPLAKFRGL